MNGMEWMDDDVPSSVLAFLYPFLSTSSSAEEIKNRVSGNENEDSHQVAALSSM